MGRLALAFLIFYTASASAFIDVEAARRNAAQGFLGKTGLTISGQSGNTEKFGSGFSTLNMQRFDGNDLLFLGDLNYSRTNGAEDTNNGRVHLRDTYLPEEPLSYEFFVQSEYDRFRKLKIRSLTGSNLRHRLAKTKSTELYAGYGIFYEWQTWSNGEHHDDWRANFYASFVGAILSTLTGSATFYYQPALAKLSDYRLKLQSSLESTITERLSLQLQLSLNTETVSPENVRPTDIFYGVGTTLKY